MNPVSLSLLMMGVLLNAGAQLLLKAGTNTIQLGNPTGYGPDLDRIVVAPLIGAGLSDAAVSRMCPR